MATPVYKVFMFKPLPQSYQMEDEQREETLAQLEGFQKQVGARSLLMADMVWSNEEFEYFGIEEYPSMKAMIEYHDCLRSIGWFGFVQSKSYVGYLVSQTWEQIELVMPPAPAAGESPLYKLYLIGDSQGRYEHSDQFEKVFSEVVKQNQDLGGIHIMNVYTRVTNEEWLGAGLERYPNEEALLDSYRTMEEKNWFQFATAKTFVGKAVGGLFHELK